MAEAHDPDIAMLILRAATHIIDGIQRGLMERGFRDVRPAHGFAFVRISAGDATVAEVAAHLGVTKQAASQLVEQLVQRGYVTREPDPTDRRSRRLALTPRGWECTRAAQSAAAETTATWEQQLGPEGVAALHTALHAVVVPGTLRPAW
jgi:DNA-binding MarR family transcriptional regulator